MSAVKNMTRNIQEVNERGSGSNVTSFFYGRTEEIPTNRQNRISTAGNRHKYTGTEPWATPALSTLRAGRHFLIRQTWRMQRENDGRNV